MNTPECGNCRFWVLVETPEDPSDSASGYCRRYPPKIGQDDADNWLQEYYEHIPLVRLSYFPNTESNEWCGEWEQAVMQ